MIGIRDGAGSGHYGRVEVVIGVTRMIIRQRVGSGDLKDLLTVPLPGRAKTAVTIDVRGDAMTVTVPGRPAATAVFARRLHEGGIVLAQIGTGKATVTFQDPVLTNNSAP